MLLKWINPDGLSARVETYTAMQTRRYIKAETEQADYLIGAPEGKLIETGNYIGHNSPEKYKPG